MSHLVQCLLPRFFSTRVSSSLSPPLASQVGGTKTRGQEMRKGIQAEQTEKSKRAISLTKGFVQTVNTLHAFVYGVILSL